MSVPDDEPAGVPPEPFALLSGNRFIGFMHLPFPEVVVGLVVSLLCGALVVGVLTASDVDLGILALAVLCLAMGLFLLLAGIARWRWKRTFKRLVGRRPRWGQE